MSCLEYFGVCGVENLIMIGFMRFLKDSERGLCNCSL